MDRNTKRLTRILLYIVLIMVVLSVAFCGMAYHKYQTVLKDDPAVEVLAGPAYQETLRELAVSLGDEMQVVATFRVPWNKTPVKAQLNREDGIEIVKEPEFVLDRYQWGSNIWSVRTVVLPYLDGKIVPGSLTVTFRNDSPDGVAETLTLQLPAFHSKLPELNVNEPVTAPPVEIPEEKMSTGTAIMIGITGLIIVVLTVLAILSLIRRGKKEILRPLWELTLEEVAALRASVAACAVSPEQAISTLTLILRDFLEKQFSLRAGRQTTSEFLREMDQDDSPLKDADRRFLKKFLVAADLVKFAGVSSDKDAFASAADQAEKMIRSAADAEKGESVQ